jgi:hypothetical protein
MLVPTNDAFFAINGIEGPEGNEGLTLFSVAYDAGTEANDARPGEDRVVNRVWHSRGHRTRNADGRLRFQASAGCRRRIAEALAAVRCGGLYKQRGPSRDYESDDPGPEEQ